MPRTSGQIGSRTWASSVTARSIVLDTETTGLNAALGDRIVEIGCVEIVGRRITDRYFHRYLNPEREVEEGALRVHGLTREFLADKPRFADVAAEFAEYIRGAELVIHNAEFDLEFLDREFAAAGLGRTLDYATGVVDTLALARELLPGKRKSLDALCEHYGVDHSKRALHGALLDARLLAEVYLAMTRGQDSLAMDIGPAVAAQAGVLAEHAARLVVLRATPEEVRAHEAYLDALERESEGGSLWRRLGAGR